MAINDQSSEYATKGQSWNSAGVACGIGSIVLGENYIFGGYAGAGYSKEDAIPTNPNVISGAWNPGAVKHFSAQYNGVAPALGNGIVSYKPGIETGLENLESGEPADKYVNPYSRGISIDESLMEVPDPNDVNKYRYPFCDQLFFVYQLAPVRNIQAYPNRCLFLSFVYHPYSWQYRSP